MVARPATPPGFVYLECLSDTSTGTAVHHRFVRKDAIEQLHMDPQPLSGNREMYIIRVSTGEHLTLLAEQYEALLTALKG